MDWFLWIIGFLILMTIAVIVQRKFRTEARRSAAEEQLDRLREKITMSEEKLESLTEGEEAYWDAQEELNELKAEEWLILTEWALIKSKRVEAYECPKCLGEGIDERSFICDFCKGAGIIRADRLYTRGWNVWDEDNRPEA